MLSGIPIYQLGRYDEKPFCAHYRESVCRQSVLTERALRRIINARRCANLRRQSRTMIMALLAAALAGCATYSENASYLYGERYYRANIHTYATVITAVDGQATMLRSVPVPIEPGQHVVELVTAPAAGFRIPETRALTLNVEPCKRYFIVAERDNRLQQNWRPVVEHVDDAGGRKCH
jgi:hypothetical protein